MIAYSAGRRCAPVEMHTVLFVARAGRRIPFTIDVLIVCTANRCRSVMAEAILRRRLDERGVSAQVGSAGFLGEGHPPMDDTIVTMAEDGLDVAVHRSRDVKPELILASDLVVAMTRQHVLELALLVPDDWQRVFQLRDLVRRAEAVGPRAPGQSLQTWLAFAGAGRTRSGLLAAPIDDDIADPVGGPRRGYEQTRRVLDDLLTRLADLVA